MRPAKRGRNRVLGERQRFCIFFGPTPISAEGEIRIADKVSVFGKIKENLKELKQLMDRMSIEVIKLQ